MGDISDANKKVLGEYITKGTVYHYCTQPVTGSTPSTSDGKFITELDITASNLQRRHEAKLACDSSLLSNAEWTGTRCCGEPGDGANEYYPDGISNSARFAPAPNTGGACWKSKAYMVSTAAPSVLVDLSPAAVVRNADGTVINSDVLVFGGLFYGCQKSGQLQQLEAMGTVPTITPVAVCGKSPVGATGKFICSKNKKWWSLDGARSDSNGYTLSIRPGTSDNTETRNYFEKPLPTGTSAATGEFASECCLQTECWNGMRCIAANNMADILTKGGKKYGCFLDGSSAAWRELAGKISLKEKELGYCLNNNQCLVSTSDLPDRCKPANQYYPAGWNENNALVESEVDVADNFCQNIDGEGIWTSRTKLVAAQLLKLASNNYALLCGPHNYVLNNLDGIGTADNLDKTINFGQDTNDINQILTTNNICALRRPRAGTATNYDITLGLALNDDPNNALLQKAFGAACILGTSSGQINSGSDRFTRCDSAGKLWYNPAIKALIFNKNGFSQANQNSLNTNIGTLSSDSMTLVDYRMSSLLQQFPATGGDARFRADPDYPIKDFNTIYIEEVGTGPNRKTIYGLVEKPRGNTWLLGVHYTGLGDVCTLAKNTNGNFLGDMADRLECAPGTPTYIKGSSFVKDTMFSDFSDLTSKLRIP
ncbi:hypothetical protein HYT54_00720 [Candidatus Woesearchaeota archaeon]|nr:hypothetical protein [Candidatus Woesearchaeota archaeon]